MGIDGRLLRGIAFSWLTVGLNPSFAQSPNLTPQDVFEATHKSVELLRSPRSFLMQDALHFGANGPRIEKAQTTPTNLGLDVIFLQGQKAVDRLNQVIDSLEKLPRDPKTGLFFGWYNVDDFSIVWRNLSSIDNLHLALALWSVQEDTQLPAPLRQKAKTLYQAMDFSIFLDTNVQLLRGNFFWKNNDWEAEPYYYSHYGSEARSLYILGHVLNLFRSKTFDIRKSLAALEIERSADGSRLHLWDGGAFQLFLPELLLSESRYSNSMQAFFRAYARVSETDAWLARWKSPGAFSACFATTEAGMLSYKGQAGLRDLTSRKNSAAFLNPTQDLWQNTLTPHAFYIQLDYLSAQSWDSFHQLSQHRDGINDFYHASRGWLDGLQVSGLQMGRIAPVQISLDQYMILLSLQRRQSPDHMTATARALSQNAETRRRLTEYYQILEETLKR